MAQILRFYDEQHTYTLDGENIPSVSELTRFLSREIYGDISQYRLDHAAERGSIIHKACENLDRFGDCEISEEYAPYIRAYMQFRTDYTPQYIAIEKPFASPSLRFAGTPDRIARMSDGRKAIIDLKSSSVVQKTLASAQLNGYRILCDENTPDLPITHLYILHLRPDASYKLISFPLYSWRAIPCIQPFRRSPEFPRKKRKPRNERNRNNVSRPLRSP